MGKPVGAAISRPPTFETERLNRTLYPVSWRAADSRPYEACRLSGASVAVRLFPLIRPGLCPVHLPRRGRRPPGGGCPKGKPSPYERVARRSRDGCGAVPGRTWYRPSSGPYGATFPQGKAGGPLWLCFFSSGRRSRPGKTPPDLRRCSGGLWKCCGYPPENRRTGPCKGTG